jgi:membrane associated rhomboid family serine protease
MAWRPEWDDAPRHRLGFGGGRFGRAWASRLLVALCVLVTLVATVADNWFRGDGEPSAITPWLALHLGNAKWVYPFFTYVLPHDTGSPLHLLLNMVMLWLLGEELELKLGRTRFLTLFFGAALTGAAAFLAVEYATRLPPSAYEGLARPLHGTMLLGASGGLFGLLVHVARESPNRPFFFYFVAVPAKVLVGLFVLLDVYPLLFGRADGVAHVCHLGGAAFGWVWYSHPFDAYGALPAALRSWRASAAARATQRTAERDAADDAEMDRLLQKIQEQGMPSLTASERRFLEERSRRLRDGRR